MNKVYITKQTAIDFQKESLEVQKQFILKAMTPDMILAMQAGCNFTTRSTTLDNGDVLVTISTVEKVSILKTQQGLPISVIIKK